MILYYIILFVTKLLAAAFSFLGVVTSLPSILGVDVDGNLVAAMGYFYGWVGIFWPVAHIFVGGLVLLGYLVIKNLVLKLMLGHRAPH